MTYLLLVATALLCVCLPVGAREIYNSPAAAIGAGVIAADTMPDAFVDCDYHLRIEIPRDCADASWGVRINAPGGSSVDIALRRQGKASAENDYGLPLEVTVSRQAPDRTVCDQAAYKITDDINVNIGAWSLTLQKRPHDSSLLCSVGQRTPLLDIDLGLPSDSAQTITAHSLSPLRLARLSCFVTPTERLSSARFTTADSLLDHLAASADPVEGRWQYLDRDTDPRLLNTGGDYSLATVTAADGSIEIVYLGGSKANTGYWRPMMLKGRLTPTPFVGHYDLVWYDAYGARIDSETSADITADGSIMRLNFPLHGGSLRFRKVRP